MTAGTKNLYFQIYFWILVYIAISLPLSKYTMSMGSLMLLTLWLCDDFQGNVVYRFFRRKGFFRGIYLFVEYLLRLAKHNLIDKSKIFLRNKPAVIFSFIYFIHLIALFNTSNFSYGMKDLRVKIPLLFFPLVFSSMKKLDYTQFRKLLLFYVTAIFAGTLISSYLLIRHNYLDIREISPFISSIRFGLNISFGFFILLYFVSADTYFSSRQKILMLLLAIWFVLFLFFMESITSLSIIMLISLGFLFIKACNSRRWFVKTAFLLLFFLIPTATYLYLSNVVHKATTVSHVVKTPDKYTALGNPYTFDSVNRGVEDGKYVGWYLCEPELEKAWDKRSSFDYRSRDKKGEELRETLIRYLNSKNLRKDASGVAALSKKDIYWIENGIANYNYIAHPGLHSRILKIIKGYQVYNSTGNPSGSSLMQRFEYWKAALGIIKHHFWIGVGTGDLEDAFYGQFSKMHSQLSPQFMFHAHNQYLAIWVAFGLVGFVIFLVALFYPLYINHAYRDYFLAVFYAIILISMFSDDTLETHTGATLFAFFSALILFGKQRKKA